MGYKTSRWSRIVTLLMCLEGVTKDKRQLMGKEKRWSKMGGENMGYKQNPDGVEL